jgi:hypothetical protein
MSFSLSIIWYFNFETCASSAISFGDLNQAENKNWNTKPNNIAGAINNKDFKTLSPQDASTFS